MYCLFNDTVALEANVKRETSGNETGEVLYEPRVSMHINTGNSIDVGLCSFSILSILLKVSLRTRITRAMTSC